MSSGVVRGIYINLPAVIHPMAFTEGITGIVGGALLFVIAGFYFGSVQYLYPTQAAIAFALAVIGLAIMLMAPAWFWLLRPVWRRIPA